MKSFIYTCKERISGGHQERTVRIYRMIRGVPVFVADGSDTYVSEMQLVMQVMEQRKLLPKYAFVRNPQGGYALCYTYLLRQAKIANVNKVA